MNDEFTKALIKKYPDFAWITGKGDYALIALCGEPTIQFYKSEEVAQRQSDSLARFGCGERCTCKHLIMHWLDGRMQQVALWA